MTPPDADDLFPENRARIALGPGAVLLGGFASLATPDLVTAVRAIAELAPFRQLETPGGRRMSVAMTNAGRLGWTSDRSGYRYRERDPLVGRPWPAMPVSFLELAWKAAVAAGFEAFHPDVCLVNRYEPGSRLSLHQDKDERDHAHPIVSVSLGLDATFLWGGSRREDRVVRVALRHGDVVVWGDPSRLAFHGVASVGSGTHPLTGAFRYNLTFRRAIA